MPWIERVTADWRHWDFAARPTQPLPGTPETTHEEQLRFEIRFLEDVLAARGEAPWVLEQLAYLYTQAGRYRDGLAVDRRLVAMRPRDAEAHYNLACSYSLLNQTTRAFFALKKAIGLGYRDAEHLETDPDLDNLRQDPRWGELLGVLS